MLGRMNRDRMKYRLPNSSTSQKIWDGKCQGSKGGNAAFSAPLAASAARMIGYMAYTVLISLENKCCGLDHEQNEDRDQEGQNAERF
mmetsp:Transcript_20411/g.35080  ORF Transcript_20411/g.35080 Transcript_20411/m.35080 type:complete len:87 (-) Transcript_20411:179-439(-)